VRVCERLGFGPVRARERKDLFLFLFGVERENGCFSPRPFLHAPVSPVH
jgi:hypothetical protein